MKEQEKNQLERTIIDLKVNITKRHQEADNKINDILKQLKETYHEDGNEN